MDCDCPSCVRLGLAPPPHIGDCDACNADGPTETLGDLELCPECAEDPSEAESRISERRATYDDRCVRGGYEP